MTTPTTDLVSTVATQLAALGDTPVKIAESLLEAGAFGMRGAALSCPISHYLTDRCGLAKVASGFDTIAVAANRDDAFTAVPTPPAVAGFINTFDMGAFDDLVNGVVDGWQARNERGWK
jgi:hypothetical protein